MEDCRMLTSPNPLWYHRPFHSLGNLHRVSTIRNGTLLYFRFTWYKLCKDLLEALEAISRFAYFDNIFAKKTLLKEDEKKMSGIILEDKIVN